MNFWGVSGHPRWPRLLRKWTASKTWHDPSSAYLGDHPTVAGGQTDDRADGGPGPVRVTGAAAPGEHLRRKRAARTERGRDGRLLCRRTDGCHQLADRHHRTRTPCRGGLHSTSVQRIELSGLNSNASFPFLPSLLLSFLHAHASAVSRLPHRVSRRYTFSIHAGSGRYTYQGLGSAWHATPCVTFHYRLTPD